MGLDMYLYDSTADFIKTHDYDEWEKKEVAYWRKANAIHGWFVREVQGGVDECEPSQTTASKVAELVTLCRKVLKNPKLAPRLLPSQGGFFFGGTDYDDWYFTDLRETVDKLVPILAKYESEPEHPLTYRSSW